MADATRSALSLTAVSGEPYHYELDAGLGEHFDGYGDGVDTLQGGADGFYEHGGGSFKW